MATEGNNLSEYTKFTIDNISSKRVAIVVSEWNQEITDGLLQGALSVLKDFECPIENILIKYVPGSFELALGAQYILDNQKVDGVICIGSVIKGETAHFDYVCQSSALGIKDVALKYNKPVMFCVLTDDNIEQSRARSGGQLGNKGVEAAVGMLKMIALKDQLA